ncbi:MAG: hypothetical protein GWN01_12130, partial [Nitrosopumilaceae archaeon]|nr:hypothetical protein [Nitrosopumilaceae archaeon]NIU88042.1 hypothetical protein [Nitrosopumilaceae archaeon]NIX62226.1 hypothetical protein [Nitrosopumilaceae archaeon]
KKQGVKTKIQPQRVKVDTETSLTLNLLTVVDRGPDKEVELHYNLNRVPETVPRMMIDLGELEVDIVAERVRELLQDEDMNDLKTVLETIEDVREELSNG